MNARPGSGRAQWHRHSCLCEFAAPRTRRLAPLATSHRAKFLIANPRLTFSASPTKQSTDLKSNRERIAIFHLNRQNKIPAHVTRSNRYIRHFKTSLNSPRITTYAFSNRYKIVISGILASASTPSLLPPLPCPRMSVFARAQAASRRESRR